MKHVHAQSTYRLPERFISGSHAEKLDQIDSAIQELMDIKILECADQPNVHLVAVPRRTHGGVMFIAILALLVLLVWMLGTSSAYATPSSTFWAPSVATCQGYGVPHITYDTYYGKGAPPPGAGAPTYPIDTGLTMGVLPYKNVQAEVGYDVLLPSSDPVFFFLNAKVCTPESSLFKGSPAISAGIYNLGFKDNVTDYNVFHLMFQKSLPIGGYISAGLYHGTNDVLFTNSDGNIAKTGAMVGWLSPDINVNLKGLKKINLTADVQTGKNVLGAGGAGVYLYFNDYISLLVGPVFFVDKALQPGGSGHLWTTQLDVDIPLGRQRK